MADPAWLRDLQPASFAGVRFRVFSHSRTGGKRGPDHEYPERNIGSVEDLGVKTRRFAFDAFVIGDRYHEDAQDLISALEEGAGELIHPRWGAIRAICREYSETETYTEGGIARFSLSFTEDPETTGLVVSLASDLDETAEKAKSRAALALAANLATSGSGSVADAALATVTSALGAASAAVTGPLVGGLADVEAITGALNTAPATLLTADALIAWGEALFEGIGDLAALDGFTSARPAQKATTSTDPGEISIARNDNAINGYLQQVALAEQAKALVAAVTTTFEVYEDALAALDTFVEKVGSEEGQSTITGDEYEALVRLRTKTHAEVAEIARPLVRLREIEVAATTSVLELAWDLYGDATRADEIAERNGIAHGGFVAPGVYTVRAA